MVTPRRASLSASQGEVAMSPGGGADRAAEGAAFRGACQGAARGVDKAIGDLGAYLGALEKVAVLVEKQVEPEAARGAMVDDLRRASKRLCAARDTLTAAREETSAVASAYSVPASSAEFHGFRDAIPGRIEARAAARAAGSGAALAPELQRFEREVWNVRHEGEPMPGEEEDVYVADAGRLKNQKCPITMRSVLDLEDPVAAACGHIYDRQSVLAHVSQSGPQRGVRTAKCALAGCQGIVKVADLRSCKEDVAREKKRLQRENMRADKAGGAGPRANAQDVMEL